MPQRLMTAAQVAEQFGLPSSAMLRTMRQKGLRHVPLGKAILYDEADVSAFIEASKVCVSPDPTQARGSSGSRKGRRGTSSGTKPARNGSAQLARQTAARLKKLSRNSSETGELEADPPGRVIRANFR